MYKDRIRGAGKQIAGSIKEAAGRLVGDTRLRIDGRFERIVGKLQSVAGRVKDRLRG